MKEEKKQTPRLGGKALVVLGDPGRGKTCFMEAIRNDLSQQAIGIFRLQANVDGEAHQLLVLKEEDLKTATQFINNARKDIRVVPQETFTKAMVERVKYVRSHLNACLVDVGGVADELNKQIAQQCTHAVILYKNEEDRTCREQFAKDAGLEVIGVFHSDINAIDSTVYSDVQSRRLGGTRDTISSVPLSAITQDLKERFHLVSNKPDGLFGLDYHDGTLSTAFGTQKGSAQQVLSAAQAKLSEYLPVLSGDVLIEGPMTIMIACSLGYQLGTRQQLQYLNINQSEIFVSESDVFLRDMRTPAEYQKIVKCNCDYNEQGTVTMTLGVQGKHHHPRDIATAIINQTHRVLQTPRRHGIRTLRYTGACPVSVMIAVGHYLRQSGYRGRVEMFDVVTQTYVQVIDGSRTLQYHSPYDLAPGESKTVDLKRLGIDDSAIEQSVDLTINPELLSTIMPVMEKLSKQGYDPVIVGGAVRDALLGKTPKDLDIEVYGISLEELKKTLSLYGKVDAVGNAFGVLKFIPYGVDGTLMTLEEPFDFAVPRRESKTGLGYKGFGVELADNISKAEASGRRDFARNSLMYDPIEKILYNYRGGLQGLTEGQMRHTSPAFAEDPLRILRAMQFQARMGQTIHSDTYDLMRLIIANGEFDHLKTQQTYSQFVSRKKQLTKSFDTYLKQHNLTAYDEESGGFDEYQEYLNVSTMLPLERVSEEWLKRSEKGLYHGKIFEFLEHSGIGELLYPELLSWYRQNPVVMSQTLATIKHLSELNRLSSLQQQLLLFAGLLYPGGGEQAIDLAKRMGLPNDVTNHVSLLVGKYGEYIKRYNADTTDVERQYGIDGLLCELDEGSIRMLGYLIYAIALSRDDGQLYSAFVLGLQGYRECYGEQGFRLLIGGDDLKARSVKPGPAYGRILAAAKTAQLRREFADQEGAQAWLDNYLIHKK